MALPLIAAAVIQAAPAIIGMFQKSKKTPQERAQESMVGEIKDLSNLMANPNDPRYKVMLENEAQGIEQNFLSSLQKIIEANRRQALMGRAQIFDPERRDESIFSGIVQNKQQAYQQANQNILDRLRNSINGLNTAQGGMNQLAKIEAARRDAKRQNNLAGLSAGSQAINSFMDGMGGIR